MSLLIDFSPMGFISLKMENNTKCLSIDAEFETADNPSKSRECLRRSPRLELSA